MLLFWIANFIAGKKYSIIRVLSALTTWTSIGNSNWYITAILFMYLWSYLTMRLFKNDKVVAWTSLIGSCIFFFINHFLHRPDYCYNTIGCFSFGMLIAAYQPVIESLLKDIKNGFFYILILVICFLAVKPYIIHSSVMNLYSVFFVGIIVILMKYFTIDNEILLYFGQNAFYLYMLQRIPMILLSQLTTLASNKHLFILISFVATIVLMAVIKPIIQSLDNKILSLTEKNKR